MIVWTGAIAGLVLWHGGDAGAWITGGLVWMLGAPFIR